ncbi:MAG: N-acetylneuraminate synthase [bacterium]
MKKTFIIAEAGVNHNGNLELAYELIKAAAEAGADAVKFQIFKAQNLVTKSAQRAAYQLSKQVKTEGSQLEMLKKLQLNFEEFMKLKACCEKTSIQFLTSVFDFESADFVDDLVNMYKIPSGEIINLTFLKHIATKGKPIILSTGMSDLGEVEKAVHTILAHQPEINSDFPSLTLLHCTTNYPCSLEEVNLYAMETLKQAFKLPVGYSDHTLGLEVAISAVALGATIIEKHFTLDRKLPGPDHKASLEPPEFKRMVTMIRNIERALGDGIKKPNRSEMEIRKVVRKSLVATKDLKAGTVLDEDMITTKRPGTGIAPADLSRVLGMTLKKDKVADEVITWQDLKSAD